MLRRRRVVPAPRWLLPILALVLVLGHVCELPAYADLVASPHPAHGSGHASDHAHDPQVSCDPVDALARSGWIPVGPEAGTPPVVLSAESLAPLPIAAALEDAKRLRSRPPLFLLHASPLI